MRWRLSDNELFYGQFKRGYWRQRPRQASAYALGLRGHLLDVGDFPVEIDPTLDRCFSELRPGARPCAFALAIVADHPFLTPPPPPAGGKPSRARGLLIGARTSVPGIVGLEKYLAWKTLVACCLRGCLYFSRPQAK